MMQKNFKNAVIVNQPNEWEVDHGLYCGRKGIVDLSPNEKYHHGYVMFYPKEGKYPYRICVKLDLFQIINE